MPKRCGDPAGFTFKVTSELVGKYATTIVCRKKKFNFTAVHTEKLNKEEVQKIKWPDQQMEGKPDGTFFGGRRVDYKGLDKLSYAEKFEHQEFELNFYQGKLKKKSAGMRKIEPYPNAGPEKKSIGIPMASQFWVEDTPTSIDAATGNVIPATYRRTHNLAADYWKTRPDTNTGKFSLELKDGVLIITVKVDLRSTQPGKDMNKILNYLKKRVEAYWNSETDGYNQWVYHRRNCKRGDKCICSIMKNSKGEYISAGCCKFPFKVKIEAGGASDNVVNIHYLTARQRRAAVRNAAGMNYWGAEDTSDGGEALPVPVCTLDVYFPENRVNTYAHEVGHMMGFPDQYLTGVVADGAMSTAGPVVGAAWPIDATSVMGEAQQKVQKIHAGASWFDDWINDKLNDPVDLIEKNK